MCEFNIHLSVFDRMSEDELEMYNTMTAKFGNKEEKDAIYLLDGKENYCTRESWQVYKDAFKKLLDASKTWRSFKRECKKLDSLLVSNGINW